MANSSDAVTAVAKIGASSILSVMDSLAVIKEFAEFWRVYQEETTRRTKIIAYRDTLIEAITSQRQVLQGYFAYRFEERRQVLDQFFAALQEGVQSKDTAIIDRSLNGILGVLHDNPLQDIEKFRGVWADPRQIIEL